MNSGTQPNRFAKWRYRDPATPAKAKGPASMPLAFSKTKIQIADPSTVAPHSNKSAAKQENSTPSVNKKRKLDSSAFGDTTGHVAPPLPKQPTTTTTIPSDAPKGELNKITDADVARETAQQAVKDDVTPEVAQEIVRLEDLSPPLSPDQQRTLDLMKEGKSVFFTGSAGTGKSFLLRHGVQQLKAIHGDKHVFVTASTGVAACNIGGTTLHSFAGVGIGDVGLDDLVRKVNRSKSKTNWRACKVLVIDEISMIDAELFDKIEYVARHIQLEPAKKRLPFGGIQLVVCGDFLQLPPVSRGRNSSLDTQFCFQAESWARCMDVCVELTTVFRQKDNEFIQLLQEMRHGECSAEQQKRLASMYLPWEERGLSTGYNEDAMRDIRPTILYPHRADVEDINVRELSLLQGQEKTFYAEDTGEEYARGSLASNCPAPTELKLKRGAQVMLVRNLNFDRQLVNGARGVVLGFVNSEKTGGRDAPFVEFLNGTRMVLAQAEWAVESGGKVLARRKQFPLRLAWALSIHKSQGMTIDKLEIDLANAFEFGQAYVALSRGRSLETIRLLSFRPAVVKAHPAALNFYRQLVPITTTPHPTSHTQPTESRGIPEQKC